MIERSEYLCKINILLNNNPIVCLIGPRQVGKTTLARLIAKQADSFHYFDLEDPRDLSRLADPILALSDLEGLVIIDEIQHHPNLFQTLRVLADQENAKQRFLVLGSATPSLLKQSSESLAGRIAYLEVDGFALKEIGASHINDLWLRGNFPRSYLAADLSASLQWRKDFIRTFLERDLPQLGIRIPAVTMRRFWMMLAHYHGQIWNGSEFARAFGMSEKTVRHYLDLLTDTFVINQLSPWWENISKRQVKSPKIYIHDSGLLHALLDLNTTESLLSHPKVGASWEGFAMNTVIQQFNLLPPEIYYWSTYTGAEVDLFVMRGGHRIAFECKRTSTPKITPSLRQAFKDLQLTKAYIIYSGDKYFPLADGIWAVGLSSIMDLKIFNE